MAIMWCEICHYFQYFVGRMKNTKMSFFRTISAGGISDSSFLVWQNQSVARFNMTARVISYQFKNGIDNVYIIIMANIISHYSQTCNKTNDRKIR